MQRQAFGVRMDWQGMQELACALHSMGELSKVCDGRRAHAPGQIAIFKGKMISKAAKTQLGCDFALTTCSSTRAQQPSGTLSSKAWTPFHSFQVLLKLLVNIAMSPNVLRRYSHILWC